jgi:hypothetical protein
MVTGIASPEGMGIGTVGGLWNYQSYNPQYEVDPEYRGYLFNELSFTGKKPYFTQNGRFVSPLDDANRSYYSSSSFGSSSKKISRINCLQFLKNKKKNPITGRDIKRNGNTYNLFMSNCQRHSLIKGKKKVRVVPPIFIGKKPKPPVTNYNQSEIVYSSTSNKKSKKIISYPPGVQLEPKQFIRINNKEYKVGQSAFINSYDKTLAKITNIGPKQISLRNSLMEKEKRLSIEKFYKYNN